MSRVSSGTHRITQPYSSKHKAIDLSYSRDESKNKVLAHTEGKVVKLVKNYKTTDKTGSSYGNYVKIKHPNGYYTLYAHLKYGSVTVNKGDKVTTGQIIGVEGSTGRSTGRHLHWEVRNKLDVKINPTPYLNDNLPKMENKYTVGNYITLEDMRVREGAGTNYKIKKVKDLTPDGKKNATSKKPNDDAEYKKGTVFTALEIINKDGSVWAKSPSGYICIKGMKRTYCSKK